MSLKFQSCRDCIGVVAYLSAVASVHVQSLGVERNVYGHSLLWLVQFETGGK